MIARPATLASANASVRALAGAILLFGSGAWAADEGGCPAAEALLDVTKFAGPGAAYGKPRVEAGCEGDEVVVKSNGLPHYEFVQVTPRPLVEREQLWRIPRSPKLADEPTSIPFLGQAGFAVNGIPFFGPNEGPVPAIERYGDPIYNSIMDECLGHTANEYHYHAFHQPCLTDGVKEGQRSPVLGYAFDGFPIRGPFGCADKECREVIRMRSGYKKIGDPSINAWDASRYEKQDGPEFLDRCNGHTGPGGDYHYHSTSSFPYIIGCYSGTPTLRQARGGPPDVTQNRGRGPCRGPGGPGAAGPGGVETAAPRLGLTVERLAEVVDQAELRAHLRDPENVPFDFASAARELGVNEEELR